MRARARARARSRCGFCAASTAAAFLGWAPPAQTPIVAAHPTRALTHAPLEAQVDHGCLGTAFDLDNYDAMVVLSHNGAFAKLHRV